MPPGLEDKMQVAEAGSEGSSSSLSPPLSPVPTDNRTFDTIRVAHLPSSSNPGFGGGVTNSGRNSAHVSNVSAHATDINTSTTPSTSTAAPEKPKRQRKKKVDIGPDGKPLADDKPKEKKPRKPREPKDKTASGEKTTAPRKKQETEPNLEQKSTHDASTQPRQPTIAESFGGNVQSTPMIPPHRPSLQPPSHPSTPRPQSSGQIYDPIRGSTIESRPENASNGVAQGSPHGVRPTASPSIASLIEPPTTVKAAAPSPQVQQTTMSRPFVSAQPISTPPTQASPPPPPTNRISQIFSMDGAMDVEPTCEAPQQVPEIKAPSKSSSAPTPPAKRAPDAPKATGSGLLSSSDLFGGPSSSEPAERKGVNIDIHIKLDPAGGNTINIAQEIVKKYGRDAINPRAAAHREQLLRIAAEQDRLGGASNDDMSVDLMSDLEDNSNVEMGGMDDEQSNTGLDANGKPKRKRRQKVEEYDKEDDFIDDTEMAWQEQAAVAKDGFFVYSGPLVPAGQDAQVETSAPSRGPRGGRARGRGAKSTTSGATHASLAEKKTTDTNGTSTSAKSTRARSTRGAGATRRPRQTKADRERLDAEKADRERAAGASTQGTTGSSNNASNTTAPTPTPAPPQPSPLSQFQNSTHTEVQRAQQMVGSTV